MPCGAMWKGLRDVGALRNGGGLLLGSIVYVHYYIIISLFYGLIQLIQVICHVYCPTV